MSISNPYDPPPFLDRGFASPQTQPGRLHAAWIGVLLLNLVVPLFLALIFTPKGGRWGMLGAIGLLGGAGLLVCTLARPFGRALVSGGLVIGLSQPVPVLQLGAGVVGLGMARACGGSWRDETTDEWITIMTEAGGFIATAVTGGLLMLAAFLAGLIVEACLPAFRRRDDLSADRPAT